MLSNSNGTLNLDDKKVKNNRYDCQDDDFDDLEDVTVFGFECQLIMNTISILRVRPDKSFCKDFAVRIQHVVPDLLIILNLIYKQRRCQEFRHKLITRVVQLCC